jgi:hypothetical protein
LIQARQFRLEREKEDREQAEKLMNDLLMKHTTSATKKQDKTLQLAKKVGERNNSVYEKSTKFF